MPRLRRQPARREPEPLVHQDRPRTAGAAQARRAARHDATRDMGAAALVVRGRVGPEPHCDCRASDEARLRAAGGALKTACALLALLCGLAQASPSLVADPYPAGPGQPSACTIDASGRPIPCILRPAPNGALQPYGNLVVLASGTYSITITVTNSANGVCTGVAGVFTCTGAPPATSVPISVTINDGVAVGTPGNVRVTFP